MNFTYTNKELFTHLQINVEKLDASNANELKDLLHQLSKQSINNLLFDFSKTKYCDSSGLSAVLQANRICKDTNGKFCLAVLQPNVLKMIQIAQLDKVLVVKESIEDAMEFMKA
jgi:anti-sigma B factor antagonist